MPNTANAGGADGRGPERRHHDRVDDAHGHPTELGQDHRQGEPQHRTQI
jgi:hypothetical protein